MKTYILLFSYLMMYFQTFCRKCGSQLASKIPDDCTQWNNEIYNCCYIQGSANDLDYKTCQGFPVWKDWSVMTTEQLQQYLPANGKPRWDIINCGVPVVKRLTSDMICGFRDLIAPKEYSFCLAQAEGCCILNYDALRICVNPNKLDPIRYLIDNGDAKLICTMNSQLLTLSWKILIVLALIFI